MSEKTKKSPSLEELLARREARKAEAEAEESLIQELMAEKKFTSLDAGKLMVSELFCADINADKPKVDWSLFVGINFAANPVFDSEGKIVGVEVTPYEQSAAAASKRRSAGRPSNGTKLSAPGTIARQQQDAYIASGGTISHRELAEKYFGKSPNVGQVFNNLRSAGLI